MEKLASKDRRVLITPKRQLYSNQMPRDPFQWTPDILIVRKLEITLLSPLVTLSVTNKLYEML